MLGETDFLTFAVLTLALVATVTDLLYNKIYNWLTLPGIVLGLMAGAYFHGWMGLLHSFLGVGAALLLYGWMFAIRVMGAGDVKLLMAMGALGGGIFVIDVAIFGILVGGVMALGILIFKGRIREFARKIYRFLISVFYKNLVVEFPEVDQKLTMPFGLAIAVASVWVMFDNPMVNWGLRLW